jgi:hypothetical protein
MANLGADGKAADRQVVIFIGLIAEGWSGDHTQDTLLGEVSAQSFYVNLCTPHRVWVKTEGHMNDFHVFN